MRTAIAFILGFSFATFALTAVAYSENVKIHWTKHERYIQVRHSAIRLVRQ